MIDADAEAAKRLAEVTGHEATTLHRLLEWNPREGGFQPRDAHVLPLEQGLRHIRRRLGQRARAPQATGEREDSQRRQQGSEQPRTTAE